MKHAIAGIILVDAAILIWAWHAGSIADFAMMAFALVCITFFGSLPIALGVLSRRKAERARAANRAIIAAPVRLTEHAREAPSLDQASHPDPVRTAPNHPGADIPPQA